MLKVEPFVKATEVVRRTPTVLNSNGTSNIGCVIVAPVGPRIAHIQGPKQFINTFCAGGIIPRNVDTTFVNAYYLSHSSSLVVARSQNTTACSGLLFQKNGNPIKVLYKDNTLLTKQTDVEFYNAGNTWSFVLNDTVFFNGSYASIQADDDYRSYQNFIQAEDLSEVADSVSSWKNCTATFSNNTLSIKHGVFEEFSTETKVITVADDTERFGLTIANANLKDIVVVTDTNTKYEVVDLDNLNSADGYEVYTGKTNFKVLNKGIQVGISKPSGVITIPEGDWLFSVYSKAAQTSDIYKASISEIENESKNFNFTVVYDGTDGPVPETYLVSLYMEANDPNGANSYIDNLNTMPNFNFSIEVFQQELLPSTTPQVPFGASGLDLISCKRASNLKAALGELEDQVMYDIDYLAPVGITNLSFLKRYIQAGRTKFWFTPVDVPRDRTNVNSIAMYTREIDDDSNVYCCGPFDKNSGLTGWVNFIACSTLYYERVMRNKAMGAEFAPVHSKNYGTIQMVSPVYQLTEKDRNSLLSLGLPINFVKYDQRDDVFYLNDNDTHYSVNDVIREEQNRRLVNKLKRDLIRLLDQFKGMFNTVSTRTLVVSMITYYFQNNITNKKSSLESFNVICDDSQDSNPVEVIRANQLEVKVQVKLLGSVKYITVAHEVKGIMPLYIVIYKIKLFNCWELLTRKGRTISSQAA